MGVVMVMEWVSSCLLCGGLVWECLTMCLPRSECCDGFSGLVGSFCADLMMLTYPSLDLFQPEAMGALRRHRSILRGCASRSGICLYSMGDTL